MSTPQLAGLSQILGAKSRRYAVVNVPNIGAVRISSLSEQERSAYESEFLAEDARPDVMQLLYAKRRLIVLCVVDAEGNRIMNEGHVEALGEVDSAATGLLFDKCREHCGFESGDVERLVKKSRQTTGSDSA